MNPFVEQLGYGPHSRLVIFHADDVGMCHGSNRAFLELTDVGIIRTGSIMAPCSWSPEILQQCQANPDLDVGVHLTLTSEWSVYRWGPLSTRDPQSGLLDGEGWFPHRVPQVQAQLNVEATLRELRTQIEYVRAAGVDFTHLDTHMGAATIPELIAGYIELGLAYQVPVLLPRQMDDYMRSLGLDSLGDEHHAHLVALCEGQGMPLVDWFRITPDHHLAGRAGERAELYEEILRNLAPGITYFSLHPNAPGEIEALVPERAYWRTFEYEYFRSDRLQEFLAAENIVPIGFREIRDLMRSHFMRSRSNQETDF